jgi:hypothetical protein
MATYEAPTATYPIFDSLVFQAPNTGTLTIADGDARYLGRTSTATSIATATQFAGDVSVGNSTLDYTSGNGLFIKTTANGEAMYLRTLSAGGATLQKIELNPTHMHLYDAIRITDSSAPTNYTLLQQSTTTLNIDNQIPSSVINLKTKTAGSVAVTPLSLSSTAITANLPITIGYTVALTSFNQIGYTLTLGGTAPNVSPMVNGQNYNLNTAGTGNMPIGVYVMSVYMNIIVITGGNVQNVTFALSSASNALSLVTNGFAPSFEIDTTWANGKTMVAAFSWNFVNTVARSHWLVQQINFSTGVYSTSNGVGNFQITRIA